MQGSYITFGSRTLVLPDATKVKLPLVSLFIESSIISQQTAKRKYAVVIMDKATMAHSIIFQKSILSVMLMNLFLD